MRIGFCESRSTWIVALITTSCFSGFSSKVSMVTATAYGTSSRVSSITFSRTISAAMARSGSSVSSSAG